MYVEQFINMSSRFSSISEANASELLANLEDITNQSIKVENNDIKYELK